MPGLDQTGPQGRGNKTGLGLGKCNQGQTQQQIRHLTQHLGRSVCWCNSQTRQEKIQVLQKYKKFLEAELEEIYQQESQLNLA